MAADILGPVTPAKASGAKYILVVTDYFTKYVVCVPLERTTAEDVARAIVENWVLTFGAPDCLHTDQGANFCSELLLEVCKIFGTEKTRTSPYHPQGNVMVERHNRVVADVISKYCTNKVAGIKRFPISTSSIIRPYTKQQDRLHFHLFLDKNANTRLSCYSRNHLVAKLPTTNSQNGSMNSSGKHI